MDALKLHEKNIILQQTKELQSYLKKNYEVIERLRSSTEFNVEFNRKQIQKLTDKNKEYESTIENFNTRLEKLMNNELNEELEAKLKKEQEKLQKHQTNNSKKKKEKEEQKTQDDLKLKKFYNNNKYSSNDNSEYFMQKETNKFGKDCDCIPDHMLEKLKDMPNNKGFIWRGIWCFGQKPAQSDKIVMMEKKGNLLKILEIDEDYRYYYEKNGKENKILVKKERRNKDLQKYVMKNVFF